MNKELIDALGALEKEKKISREVMLDIIKHSLIKACERIEKADKTYGGKNDKAHVGKADNIHVEINSETGEFSVFADKVVSEYVDDAAKEISLEEAQKTNPHVEIGDVIKVQIQSKQFGRIVAQNAKNIILQKIREEERKILMEQYAGIEKEVHTAVVKEIVGKKIIVSLGEIDAILGEKEQIESEILKPSDKIKVYINEVRNDSKDPRIFVSRTHPELIKRLFESEVPEIKDGVIEIKHIVREAGSRTKIAVMTNNEEVDPIGTCVGMQGQRVAAIVAELNNEKIDIVKWDENPAQYIENALSPAEVISVVVEEDSEEKKAQIVVADNQLSLAIGKHGQNARLAAKLTGYKIDIKSRTQAKELELDYEGQYADELEDDYFEYETEDNSGMEE